MIEIGSLVKYNYDEDIGLITKIIEDPMCPMYWIEWFNGTDGDYFPHEFEVIA